jgi:hypothetical protein
MKLYAIHIAKIAAICAVYGILSLAGSYAGVTAGESCARLLSRRL